MLNLATAAKMHNKRRQLTVDRLMAEKLDFMNGRLIADHPGVVGVLQITTSRARETIIQDQRAVSRILIPTDGLIEVDQGCQALGRVIKLPAIEMKKIPLQLCQSIIEMWGKL